MKRKQPTFTLTSPEVPEHALQRSIVRVLRLELGAEGKISEQGVVWFSIDHATNSWETIGERAGRGVPAGIYDMLVLFQGRAFWIEIKSRDGTVSDPQRSMAASLLLSGCRIGVARDADEVLQLLDAWDIPRKRRVRIAA